MKKIRYRKNVAFILRREEGLILICERGDRPGSWQFPQGGVKSSETPELALVREVLEEISLRPEHYEILEKRDSYRYEFRGSYKKDGFRGQDQTYFLAEAKAMAHNHLQIDGREFRSYRWIHPHEFQLTWVSSIKRNVYQRVFLDFFGVELS